MANTGIYKRYVPSLAPRSVPENSAWLFIFQGGKILIKEDGDRLDIPMREDLNDEKETAVDWQYLGELDACPCYCLDTGGQFKVPAGLLFKDLRALLGQVEEDIFLLAGRAFQVVNWRRMNKFCGKCGGVTELLQGQLAKKCPHCGSIYYPRISPAVIVAVRRGDQILLAHNKNFRPNWYSVIAGFVEPGETFEECVKREVMEEVGIRIKNIKYFGSQPWPFPDSLMVGFTAEYASGEIVVDGEEIEVADWYGRNDLPPSPTKTSIAGRLIEAVLSDQRE